LKSNTTIKWLIHQTFSSFQVFIKYFLDLLLIYLIICTSIWNGRSVRNDPSRVSFPSHASARFVPTSSPSSLFICFPRCVRFAHLHTSFSRPRAAAFIASVQITSVLLSSPLRSPTCFAIRPSPSSYLGARAIAEVTFTRLVVVPGI
jgi:hypothetical protein